MQLQIFFLLQETQNFNRQKKAQKLEQAGSS